MTIVDQDVSRTEGVSSPSRILSRPPLNALVKLLARWSRTQTLSRVVYSVVGIGTAIFNIFALWLIIEVLPSGSSPTEVVDFFDRNNTVLRIVAFVGVLGMGVTVWVMAAFTATITRADKSESKALSWIAISGDIVISAAVTVEVGMFASLPLLTGHVSADFLQGMHVVVFVIAAVFGPLFITYLVPVLVIGTREKVLPKWLVHLSAWMAATNFICVFGLFTLDGPLNLIDGGGLIAGTIPIAIWAPLMVAWVLLRWLTPAVQRAEARL